jgi:hypothetical protein
METGTRGRRRKLGIAMTEDLKTKSVAVIDNGIFSEAASTLAKSFGKTYYTSPWVADFPSSAKVEIGEGFPEYERVASIWQVIDDVDLFVFTDLHQGDLQNYLAAQGKRVFGARNGDELETQRTEAKAYFESLGIPQAPYEVVKGMENLRKYLEGRNDKVWVKISLTRNDTETFPVEGYAGSKNRLDRLEAELGPAATEMEFIVEDDLPDTLDIAIDTYCINGDFPSKAMLGTEKKDEGYVCAVKDWKEMPPKLMDIYHKLASTLGKYDYRCVLSLECRMGAKETYLCDPCCRGGSPPFELQLNMIENLAEIVWAGADGEMVQPKFAARYGAQFIVESKWVVNNPLLVEFPAKYREQIKFRYATMFGKELWIMPQRNDTPGFASIVVTGDSLDACFDEAREISDQIKGCQVECCIGSVGGLKENLAQFKKLGVQF